MTLLCERIDDVAVQIIEEGEEKKLHISGPFIQMDVVNGNKRLYPSEYIAPKIDAYNTSMVQTNRALGELNHPGNPYVNPERAAIKIVSLQREGSSYMGKARVLETVPMGNILAGLLREGVQMAVSTRATGSTIQKNGVAVVQPDFQLLTAADVVTDPSAPDAFVQAIMENKQWVYKDGILVEEDAKAIINKNPKNLLKAMQDILKLIN
mgnify:FL=1